MIGHIYMVEDLYHTGCMTTQMNIQMGNNETEDLNAGNTGYGFDHRLYYVKLMNRTIRYEIC